VAPYVYVCMPAGAWPDPEYVVRAAGDPRTVMAEVREIVRSLDPSRALFGVRPVEDVVAESLDQPRLNARVLVLFAASALALASLGLYSVIMLLVTERKRELGVRMALGAAPAQLWRLVLAGAGRLVAAGLAAGFVLLLVAGQIMRALLFGVSPLDAPALGAAVATLGLVALVATLVPARRAASLSAIDALRE
jgi:putative ABC transport system permease protein